MLLATLLFGVPTRGQAGPLLGQQIRLTEVGGLGDTDYWATDPRLAYNDLADEFLLVWQAQVDTDGAAPGKQEVFARRIDGRTGAPLGTEQRLTYFGVGDDPRWDASSPSVVYNRDRNEYYVAFVGSDTIGEREIYGVRLSGTSGQRLEVYRQVSSAGPDLDVSWGVASPSVTYNPSADEYLVAWVGSDDDGGHVAGEMEVWVCRVNAATGWPVETGRRISEMGPVGSAAYDARHPQLAYDPVNDQYVVGWLGDHDQDGQQEGEFEVFFQLLDGATGLPDLPAQRRVSEAGGGLGNDEGAWQMRLAVLPRFNEFLIIWREERDGRLQLVAQRFAAGFGVEIGIPDHAVHESDTWMNYFGLAADEAEGGYLITFAEDDPVDGEFEGRLLRLDSVGEPVGPAHLVGDMEGSGPHGYDVEELVVAVSPVTGRSLVAWVGDHEADGQVEDEYEVYYNHSPLRGFASGFESGTTGGWSGSVGEEPPGDGSGN